MIAGEAKRAQRLQGCQFREQTGKCLLKRFEHAVDRIIEILTAGTPFAAHLLELESRSDRGLRAKVGDRPLEGVGASLQFLRVFGQDGGLNFCHKSGAVLKKDNGDFLEKLLVSAHARQRDATIQTWLGQKRANPPRNHYPRRCCAFLVLYRHNYVRFVIGVALPPYDILMKEPP